MIDSVLKGTGNSRFLKSAVPAGTSWADALAMLQAGTFPIDFNGINTEGFQQVGTPLNKANLLKDATAAQIGLPPSTTPDGMFQALGNTGELHVWRKTVTTSQEIPAGYKLGDAESGTAFSVPNSGSQNYVTLQYGPSITVNDGGGVSLTSVTGSVQFKKYSNVSDIYDIRNNFVKAIPNGGSDSAFDGVIFVPNDCSFKNTDGIVTFGKFYRVNAYPLTPAGTTTTYPVSTNPNAYQEGSDAKPAGYTLGEVVSGNFPLSYDVGTTAQGSKYYVYNTMVNITDDGVVSVANPIGIYISNAAQSNITNAQVLKGKFIERRDENGTIFKQNVVYYIPEDAVISGDANTSDTIYVDRYQPVTGYAAIPAGTTIEYLGKLGDKARVQVVSYVGTGTYGSSNPNSLTFDFAPKVVMFLRYYKSGITQSGALGSYGSDSRVITPESLTTTYAQYNGFGDKSYSYAKKSKDGKTIFWYNDSSFHQGNDSGYIYYFLVIG